jgi:hypothetical protein
MLGVSVLVGLGMVLSCSLPQQLMEDAVGGLMTTQIPGGDGPPPASDVPAPEPLVVTHQGDVFPVYALDGTLRETRPATGLEYARPNTAQVAGQSIYYVDSAGSSLGGVVRRVTAAGVETLDFTAAEDTDTLTFAVSEDETRIAWTHTFFGQASRFSKLWIAGIDGSDPELIVETGTPDSQPLPEYFALEAVRWMDDGGLIYAWQVTGIGGYILFFGWSSFYRYSPADGASTPLIPASEEGAGPCWYALSPDGAYAAGGCGPDGMRQRELSGGAEITFPVLPDQGQQGAAAYSPSGEGLAYAIARGNYDDESGQVLVRMSSGEDPSVLSTQTPGYFERILWADDDRMVVGYAEGESSAVDLLTIDGTRTPIGDGRLIGLMRSAAPTASLGELVNRGDLEIQRVTANGEIAGPGIAVEIYNPGPADIATTIPCGFIFEPDDGSDQRLMVVQEARGLIPSGSQATLTAYVVCIDSHSDTPDEGAGYALGTMQSGSLLQLAECACRQDLAGSLNPFEGEGLMTAGWMISEGKLFSEMDPGESEGAMGQAFSQFIGLLEQPAMGWFDRCSIPLP